jgi:hypothetical protein
MLYLAASSPEANDLYLDIQSIEERWFRDRSFFAVSGVCGDGEWEEEVLIEVGAETAVTFVDDYLDPARLRDFFLRYERGGVETALRQALAGLQICLETVPGEQRSRVIGCAAQGRWLPQRPRHWGEQLELPLAIAEEISPWGRRAA